MVLPCVCQGSGGGPHGARWDTDGGDKEDGSPGFEGPGFCTWEPPYLPIGGVHSKAPHRLSHWGHKPKSGSPETQTETQVARPLAPPSPACLQAFPNIQRSCFCSFRFPPPQWSFPLINTYPAFKVQLKSHLHWGDLGTADPSWVPSYAWSSWALLLWGDLQDRAESWACGDGQEPFPSNGPSHAGGGRPTFAPPALGEAEWKPKLAPPGTHSHWM